MGKNIDINEVISRVMLALIIDVAVVQAQISPLFAVASIYLFFTALIQWDPLYFFFNVLRKMQARNVIRHTLSYDVSI